MPTLSVYRLHFRAGLHLGVRGVTLEEAAVSLPSDTLFSALVDAWQRLGGPVERWLAPFLQEPPDPPFVLTSAFPFAGAVRFYPMPVDLRGLFAQPEAGKRVKRIAYLSEGLLRRALSGEKLDDWLPPEGPTGPDDPGQSAGLLLQEGKLWLDGETELKQLPQWMRVDPKSHRPRPRAAYPHLEAWKEGRTPRVTIDRISSAPNIFHIGQVRFAEECGLWFGVQWRRPAQRIEGTSTTYADSVTAALQFLQDEGLGGDRSVGYGAFTLETGQEGTAREAVSLPDSSPGGMAWLLSRFHPHTPAEIATLQAEGVAYRLVDVAGWLRSPDGPAQRRRRIHLLAEGSWLPAGETVLGGLVDVQPVYENQEGMLSHPVYRSGFGVAVGFTQEANHG